MDGAPPAEENYEALPIEDRLGHKASARALLSAQQAQSRPTLTSPSGVPVAQLWKARLSGYNALITALSQTVSESDPLFKGYVNNPASVRDWVKDPNAVSQEKGVEAACALVEYGGKPTAR